MLIFEYSLMEFNLCAYFIIDLNLGLDLMNRFAIVLFLEFQGFQDIISFRKLFIQLCYFSLIF